MAAAMLLSLRQHVTFSHPNLSRKILNNNNNNVKLFSLSSRINSVAELQEQNNATETNSQLQQASSRPPAEKMRSFFKTRNAFLKNFDQKLKSGEVLSIPQAFGFIKSCGPRMVGESDVSRTELVNHVWNQLQKNGVELDIGLWNTLLSVYVENRHNFEPLEFLKNLWENSKAEPNKTTFSLLIQAYAMKGDPEGAMKIVDFMIKNNSKMTEHIYAWLVQAFAMKGDMDGVNHILNSMKESGIQPRHSTFGALINAYAQRGELEEIDKTIIQMIELKVFPSVEIYINLFDHLARGGHSKYFPLIWDKIDDMDSMKNDMQPLIQSFITRGDYESALKLTECTVKQTSEKKINYIRYLEQKLFNMLQFSEKDLSEFIEVSDLIQSNYSLDHKTQTYRLIDYFLGKDLPDELIQLLSKLIQMDRTRVITPHFHPIISYHAQRESLEKIMSVFNFMKQNEYDIDYICCKRMEPALGTYGDDSYSKFLSLLKERKDLELPYNFYSELLKEQNVTLTHLGDVIHSANSRDLFSSLKEIKETIISKFNPYDASKIIIELHGRGLNATAVIVDEILQTVVANKENQNTGLDAFEFMKNLMENDVSLFSPSYTRTLKALHDSKNSDQFFMFVRLMKEHGVEPDVHQYYQMLKMAASVGNSMAGQFCFDKIMESPIYNDRINEFYQLLIIAYSRDTESSKVIPSYIQGRNAENAHKVCELFEEMEEKNYSISPLVISLAVKAYLTNRDIEGANRVMEKYGEGEAGPRTSVNNAYMRAYVANRDHQGANELFGRMKENKTVTQLQYNEMMRLCEVTGDVEKVEELYKEMLADGFVPNVFTYVHRIRTLLTNKEAEKCVDILEENIKSDHGLVRVDLFMIILRNLVPTGNIEKVKRVIELIKEHHLVKVPPKRLEHALILVHIKAGKIEEASKLLPERVPSDDPDDPIVEVELNPYRKVAKTASVEGDVDYIKNMIEFLRVNGLHYQTLDTFYLLALNKIGDTDGIRNLYEERVRDGAEMTEKFLSILEAIVEDRGLKGFDFNNR